MGFRIRIKAEGHPSLIYPPDYKVAKVVGNGIVYSTVGGEGGLKPHDRILIRIRGSDSITLEDHIIPTLWAQSREYRHDREYIFRGNGSGIPTTTTLSVMLNNIAVAQGRGEDAAEFIHGALPRELNYSLSGVAAWLNGEVMFPNKPEAIDFLAERFSSAELREWHDGLKALNYRPLERMRVIHRGIPAALAMPLGRGSHGHATEDNGREHGEAHGVTSITQSIGLIKKVYGGLFEEFVTQAEVLEVGTVGIGTAQREISSGAGIDESFTGSRLVGFSYKADSDERNAVLERFKGTEQAAEISRLLTQRAEMIVSATGPMTSVYGHQWMEVDDSKRVEITKTMLQIEARRRGVSYRESLGLLGEILAANMKRIAMNLVTFPEDLSEGMFISEHVLLGKYLRNAVFRGKVNHLLDNCRMNHAEILDAAVDPSFPWIGTYVNFFKELYNGSQMIRYLSPSVDEFLREMGVTGYMHDVLKGFATSTGRKSYDKMTPAERSVFDSRIAHMAFKARVAHRIRDSSEFKELKKSINALGLPRELTFFQDAACFSMFWEPKRALAERVARAYGLENVHPYGAVLDREMRQRFRVTLRDSTERSKAVTDFDFRRP